MELQDYLNYVNSGNTIEAPLEELMYVEILTV
jgi:hypothetical protein